jgi:hypothetical protein
VAGKCAPLPLDILEQKENNIDGSIVRVMGASVIPYNRSAWLKKLDEECPFQLTLPRRQLTDDSAIMDFLLSYAGKFDMYVEDECATYVRYCFADPLDAAVFRSRFEPKASHSGWRVEGAAQLKSSRCGTTVVAPPGLRRPSQSESTGRSAPAAAAPPT